MRPPCFFFIFFFVSFIFPLSSSQFPDSPQNIETFFPFPIVFPSPPPPPTNPISPSSPPPPLQLPQRSSSSSGTVAKAVAATAACTFVVATLLFFFVRRYVRMRRSKNVGTDNSAGGEQPRPAVVLDNHFARVDGNLKGLIVDEDGLDVLYWRKLEDENKTVIASFNKVVINGAQEQEDDDYDETVEARNGQRWKSEPVQEIPLLRGKSSTSHNKVAPGISEKPNLISQTLNPPPPPPPTPSVLIPAEQGSAPPPIPAKKNNSTPPPPPPPPVPVKKSNSISLPPPPVPAKKSNSIPPPPPPHVPAKKSNSIPPPPPPIPEKKNTNTPPPPPPPKGAGLPTSSRSPVGKRMLPGEESSSGEHNRNGLVKLKPLHWDKVNRNTDHSMVWDKIGGGSFRVDDDLMEALFGYVATNRKSPRKEGETSDTKNQNGSPPAKIAILDARKSQNIAIVLKSLGISHEEIIDAITDGQGLSADTLEKLWRIAPTKEEISQILEFEGDISTLADAESFLFHLLKAVPTAFTRLNAMLFRQNYNSEILQLKESLQTLELGCKELRNRGLFMKLLEAILKAGNRMNAGTSRGNAQAFDLTSLRKLSDVKSTNGKTTLLHFIVEEVVRVEGKRCVINRNHSLSRTTSSSSSINTANLASKEEREKEYIMLGLPMVGGLSSEFSNVKKAAQIDHDSFAGTCSALKARIADVRQTALHCAANEEGGFGKAMKGFLEAAEEEIKVLKDEQKRIMELVQKTTEYYQAGASKNKGAHPLQLFVIIKDFLDMVDQVCVEIARNLQKKKTPSSKFGSSPKSPAAGGVRVRFPNLPEHFMKEKSGSSSSESDTDF